MVETKGTERLSEVKCISWYTQQAEISQKHGTYEKFWLTKNQL